MIVALLTLAAPCLFFCLASQTDGYGRMAAVFWGFILSPITGAVVGGLYWRAVMRQRRRFDGRYRSIKLFWTCICVGIARPLLAMFVGAAAMVLAGWGRGWS